MGFPGGGSSAPAPMPLSKATDWPWGRSVGKDALWSQALGCLLIPCGDPPSREATLIQARAAMRTTSNNRGRCAKLCPHPHWDPKVSLILVPILQTRKVKPREVETETQKAQSWEGLDCCPFIGQILRAVSPGPRSGPRAQATGSGIVLGSGHLLRSPAHGCDRP